MGPVERNPSTNTTGQSKPEKAKPPAMRVVFLSKTQIRRMGFTHPPFYLAMQIRWKCSLVSRDDPFSQLISFLINRLAGGVSFEPAR